MLLRRGCVYIFVVAVIVLPVITWPGCMPGFGSYSKATRITDSITWTINLPVSLPDDYYEIRISSDTSFTLFFDKENWRNTRHPQITDSSDFRNFIFFLDSMQHADGVINTSYLPARAARCGSLSPAATAWNTMDSLFKYGQVCIRYANGNFVSKLECTYERSEIAERTYYRDAVNGKTFFSDGRNFQGGF